MALRAQIAAVALSTGLFREVLPYAPDEGVTGLVAWLGDAVAEVQMGSSEYWDWTLPLTVAVPRNARYGDEQETLEAAMVAVMAAVRADYVQPGTMGIPVVRATQGTAGPEGAKFAAITLWFRVRQKSSQTLA